MKNFFFGSIFGVLILVGLIAMCLCSCVLLMFASLQNLGTNTQYDFMQPLYSYTKGNPDSENKILLIKVEGAILTQRPSDPLSALLASDVVYGYDIKQQFIDASTDDSIKGIILYVNSPGGTITGAKAIQDGISYYKDTTGRSVVGVGSGLVASGGYWAISTADTIYLDPGSTIGSIGVIFGPITRYRNVVSNQEVMTTDGITEEYITSGKGKDIGNPYRDLSTEERQILQKSVDNAYDDFVKLISTSRGIPEDTIRNQIAAHIYDDKQALDFKLIDKIMNIDDAYLDFAETLNIEDYQIITQEKELGFFESLLGVSAKSADIVKVDTICNSLNNSLVIEENYLQACK